MGVPSLFRWLTNKYPTIISSPVPNKVDNLYLDFNAIIHSACHPTDGPTPDSEDQMLRNISAILDTIMAKIRPRKMLFISIDGVAPRAKLNQQRARRYKTAMDVEKSGKKYFAREPAGDCRKEIDNDSEISELKENSGKLNTTEKSQTNDIPKNSCCLKISGRNISDIEQVEDSSSTVNMSDCKVLKNNPFINKCDVENSARLDELTADPEVDYSLTWDTNAITPGTQFMEKVDRFMNELIQFKVSNSDLWKHLEVIFSGCSVPGEGEQKIMNFIRSIEEEIPSGNIKNRALISNGNLTAKINHLVYSPDADLIFLCLGLLRINVRVLREDLDFAERQKRNFCINCQKKGHLREYCGKLKFHSMIVVDTVEMRRFMTKEYKMTIKGPFIPEKMISDFIFLGFLAGNDFLPTLQCFDVRFEAIEQLIWLQAENFKRTGQYLTECRVVRQHNGAAEVHGHYERRCEIRFETFREFLKLLAHHENQLYAKKKKNLAATRAQFNISNFESIPLESGVGKNIYYERKLQVRSESQISLICRDYLEGLAWVFSYYMAGNKNWDWYYPHHYAPFAVDLASVRNFRVKFASNEPLSMLEQLMVVLPPQSKNLVPEPMQNISTALPQYFPQTVEIDMFDKLLPWQGVVLLPPINILEIQDLYTTLRPHLSINDIKKNVRGHNIMYIGCKHKDYKQIVERVGEHGVLENERKYKTVYYSSALPGQEAIFMGGRYRNLSIGLVMDEFN